MVGNARTVAAFMAWDEFMPHHFAECVALPCLQMALITLARHSRSVQRIDV